jgi:hypothetical protein
VSRRREGLTQGEWAIDSRVRRKTSSIVRDDMDSAKPELVALVVNNGLTKMTQDLFARHKVPVRVQVAAPFPDLNATLFEEIVTLAIKGSVAGFLGAFAAAAGRDAYRALRAFLADARATRHDQLVLVDDGTQRLGVVLSDRLPDEALRALFEVDLAVFARAGTVGWDANATRWLPGWAPTRRSDIGGWFARKEIDGRPPTWHLAKEPIRTPIAPLCGADLGDSVLRDSDPFRELVGPPCWECIHVADESRGAP